MLYPTRVKIWKGRKEDSDLVKESVSPRKTKKIKNAIKDANKAIASVKAKPKIAYPKSCFASDGFRQRLWIKLLNTFPIPTAAPANAIVAA
jgi:hypothetical protein